MLQFSRHDDGIINEPRSAKQKLAVAAKAVSLQKLERCTKKEGESGPGPVAAPGKAGGNAVCRSSVTKLQGQG